MAVGRGVAAGTLVVRISTDDKGFITGLKLAETQARRTGTGMERMFSRTMDSTALKMRRNQKLWSTFMAYMFKGFRTGFGVGTGFFAADLIFRGISKVIGVFGDAVDAAIEFEKAMANVNTIARLSEDRLEDLGNAVQDLSMEHGEPLEDLTAALYDLYSAGITGAEAMEALDQSVRLGIAGLSSTAQATDLMTSALSAYRDQNLTASHAAEVFAVAIEKGRVTAVSLQEAFGNIGPMASSLGISLDEVSSAMSFLSLSGNTASEAATQLQSVMRGLIKPNTAMKAAFNEAGYSIETMRQSLADRGLIATLEDFLGKIDSNRWTAIFGRVEAMRALYSIMQANGEVTGTFAQFMEESNAAIEEGTTLAGQYATQMDTTAKRQERFNALWQDFLVDLGESLMPIVEATLEDLATLVKLFDEAAGHVENLTEAWDDFSRFVDGKPDDIKMTLYTRQIENAVKAMQNAGETYERFAGDISDVTETEVTAVLAEWAKMEELPGAIVSAINKNTGQIFTAAQLAFAQAQEGGLDLKAMAAEGWEVYWADANTLAKLALDALEKEGGQIDLNAAAYKVISERHSTAIVQWQQAIDLIAKLRESTSTLEIVTLMEQINQLATDNKELWADFGPDMPAALRRYLNPVTTMGIVKEWGEIFKDSAGGVGREAGEEVAVEFTMGFEGSRDRFLGIGKRLIEFLNNAISPARMAKELMAPKLWETIQRAAESLKTGADEAAVQEVGDAIGTVVMSGAINPKTITAVTTAFSRMMGLGFDPHTITDYLGSIGVSMDFLLPFLKPSMLKVFKDAGLISADQYAFYMDKSKRPEEGGADMAEDAADGADKPKLFRTPAENAADAYKSAMEARLRVWATAFGAWLASKFNPFAPDLPMPTMGAGQFHGDAFDRRSGGGGTAASLAAPMAFASAAASGQPMAFDGSSTAIGGAATITHMFRGLPPGVSSSEVAEQVRRGTDSAGLARQMRYQRSFRNT